MKIYKEIYFFIIAFLFCIQASFAQQTKISDYVIFGGKVAGGQTTPAYPGYGVQLSSSIDIEGGIIGSYNLVQSTGSLTLGTNVYSGGAIQLANSNTVTGWMAAGSSTSAVSGTVISVGSNTNIGGNIDANGNIIIGGGTVSGTVTHPTGTTYSGPLPVGGNNVGIPNFRGLPAMPVINNFPIVGSTNISNNKTVSPGSYGDVTLGGNKTLTLAGPGIYVFNSIVNSGTTNNFVFDFKNDPTGQIKIYVYSDVNLGKVQASMINGGSESRIYLETHGTGTTSSDRTLAFSIANGAAGKSSKWIGTVWAPYAAIYVGSGTGSTNIVGALYSGTQVNIQSGINMIFAPFSFCATPIVYAGPDKALDVYSKAQLTGTSSIAGSSFNWTAIKGGVISSATNGATITTLAAGTYILTVTAPAGCSASDTVEVTSKVRNVIGSELQSIYDNYNPNAPAQPSPFFAITPDGYVTIDVITLAGNYITVLNLLQTATYGLKDIITNGASNFLITGKFPIINLPKLNLLGDKINFCRPYYQGVVNNGLVSSAGDTTMRSNLVRSGYTINGSGIKVGVISNSYATINSGTTATLPLQPTLISPYSTNPSGTLNPVAQTFITNTSAQDITNDDLPGIGNTKGFTTPVTVLQDFPIQQSDEGRAMLQIIHDVAPGAQLYFRTGFFSPGDFAVGIKQLKDAGCNVIVDDITFITEPFLQDGIVAKTVDTVTTQGISYFSAAGNFANKSYESNFNPVDAGTIGFSGAKAHDFGGGDMFQKVRLAPGNYTFVFQWVDSIYSNAQSGGTKSDMDIYLTKNTDGTGLVGYNRDNTNGDPIEFIPITISGTDSVDYNILIVNNTPTSNPSRIKYVVFSGGIRIMEYNQGTSTLVGQANADGAIAVGAARFNYVPNYINNPPAGYPIAVPNNPANPATTITKPQIETFSSLGGTKTNGIIRNKPELVAPDGVRTTVKMGQDYPDWALKGYSSFFGTSAAAPHAAAVAALIMQGRKKFLGEAVTTSNQVRTLLQKTATSMRPAGLVGYDYNSGSGLVNADSAMRTFAAPTPELDSLVVPKTTPLTIPGNTLFKLTVKGQNFSYNSQIYFNDSALASTIVLSNSEATAIVPMFDGNPAIRIYTPPFSSSLLDGGFSNGLHFFQANIVVSTDNIIKKYGERLSMPDTIITINGVLLKDTTLTLSDIGLGKMTLTTGATTTSDVGTYLITPSGNFDESNSVDSAFLQKYHYKFNTGTVTINKMPLKVTPNNATINYGQYIGNVTFKYDYDHTNIPNAVSFDSLIMAYHQSYLPNNALAVIKDFSKTQAGGSVLSTTDLLNMNMIASFKAVNNSTKFQLDNNNNLVPLSDPNNFNAQYIVDVASESIFNYIKDPSTSQFYTVSAGINSKAILGAAALTNKTAFVNVRDLVNARDLMVNMVNGSLVQMVNGAPGSGSLVPIANGSLVQIVNGSLVQLVNGQYVPVSNGSLVQIVNGSLVQLVNRVYTSIANGSLVQLVNGSLVQMVNGSLVQLVNGSLVQLVNGQYEPIQNSLPVQLVNGSLVQYVNGAYTPVSNGSLVQLVNGSLVQLVNGSLVQLVNGDGSTTVPIINGSLVQLVNGSLVQLVNGVAKPILNGSLVQLVNGSLVQMVNGSLVQMVNGSLVQLVNGSLVQLVNGSLVQMVNSSTIGTTATNSNTAVIIDTTDVDLQTNWIGPMFGINMITGLNPGQQSLVPGILVNSNFDITYGLGTVTIKPDTITITVKDTSRQYGYSNPAFAVSYSGFAPGDNLQSSTTGSPLIGTSAVQNSAAGLYPVIPSIGTLKSLNYVFRFVSGTMTITKDTLTVTADNITRQYGNPNPALTVTYSGYAPNESLLSNSVTGTPSVTTTAVPTSPIGTYPILVANGTLSSPNYLFNFVNSVLTVTSNACLLAHSTFTNFSNTSKVPTSLWLNVETKISGQLINNGDYIIFTAGTITLNNIKSNPTINSLPIPDGKVIADNTISVPVTSFDATNNMWITRVPLGFSSTSNIFITGAIINSSIGFVKNGGNTSSDLNGIFYSNQNYKDQWGYGIAAYQPQFNYSAISGAGIVTSIKGDYPSATPTTQIQNLVSGGSGNGSSSYSGSTSSYDNFTACPVPANYPVTNTALAVGGFNSEQVTQNETISSPIKGMVQIVPNPASNYIMISFVPFKSGNSRIALFRIDGKMVYESQNGLYQAGRNYVQRIDVSKYPSGIYLVQITNVDKIITNKIIITR